MQTATHRRVGVATVLGTSLALGWPLWQTAIGATLGYAISGGVLSPDMDQRWKGRVPQKGKNPFRHRGITHWWGTILIATAIIWVILPSWVAIAAGAAWGSHLIGDFIFGAKSPYRGPGIPFAPWWGYQGVGLYVGTAPERFIAVHAAPFIIGVLIVVSITRAF